jgi:hypothetical protein
MELSGYTLLAGAGDASEPAPDATRRLRDRDRSGRYFSDTVTIGYE